ncbi:D-alanine--D-alanine ligase family protein [Actinomadura livida]|uniref:D-alanine--D-alanine ligase n=1 Tax=Actinomadura livida TaxID=79909 RepID=A0A7W7IKW0_9ACTN|nr:MULTISPECIES: D-alanine--D-alanine ligase [Actinomadura]MBB4778978.1 D-alanine-D-alanine ligase [Actinomadura catellatispora]GGU27085.1 D-alanine--D-alanine ligase [Actinomadura livida]
MELGHVVVLAGGLSYEREVSLRSGRRVSDALRALDIPVELRDADATLLDSLTEDPPDAVFPVLHGAAGEDGSIRDILELLDVPYVGARPDACRVAWDKPTAKSVVRRADLRTPKSVALPKEIFHDLGAASVLDRIIGSLGLPLFVKPTRGGSALGASVVHDAADLSAAMVGCFAYGDSALVEQYVAGTEVAVSVIERDGVPVALPAVEIVAPGGRYDYTARYDAGDTEFITPARLTPDATARATAAAVTAHRALGLRDLSRTDLIVSPDGEVHFLEVNVAPGMTETSLFPRAISGADLDLGEVCRDLLATRLT